MTVEELYARRVLREKVRLLNTKGAYSRAARALRLTEADNAETSKPGTSDVKRLTLNHDLLQWMAGFFDAEGSVCIEMQIRKKRSSPRFSLHISVSNSDMNGLLPFVWFYGGRVYQRKETRSSPKGLKWSDIYDWYCPQASAMRFVDDAAGLLLIKVAQAVLARRFLVCVSKAPPIARSEGGTFGRLSPYQIEARMQYREEMLRLNNSGFN